VFTLLSLIYLHRVFTTDPGVIPKPWAFQIDPSEEHRAIYTDVDKFYKYGNNKRFRLVPHD
jgi:hypothetical protein